MILKTTTHFLLNIVTVHDDVVENGWSHPGHSNANTVTNPGLKVSHARHRTSKPRDEITRDRASSGGAPFCIPKDRKA